MAKAKRKFLLDPALEKYYAEGNEQERLTTYRLEKERTLQILKKWLPSVPAIILDVGGAAGVYSFPLAKMGYEVHLIDPIDLHIEQAKKHAKNSRCKLASYSVGDARQLEQSDNFVDVVLLLGALYHLIKPKDRSKALREAYRVLKTGGLLFAAAIPRFALLMDAMYKRTVSLKFEVIKKNFKTGVYHNVSEGFTSAYFHLPEELKNEIQENGFVKVSLRAIEGPVWETQFIEALSQDEQWKKALMLLEEIETEKTIIGASAHIMAIGSKESAKGRKFS